MKVQPDLRVQRSFDYNKFKFVKWNRDLNKSNLLKLESENKKKFQMHLFPIVVDKKLNIIDGQHRFQVCKANGWEVFFLQDKEELKGTDDYYEKIRSVNAVGRKHTTIEKFNMLAKTGHKEAQYVNEVFYKFKQRFALITVLNTLSTPGSGGATKQGLDNGVINLIEERLGEDLLEKIDNTTLPGRHKDVFVRTMRTICKVNDIDVDILLTRLEDYGFEVKKFMSKELIREKILSIWNHKRRKNRIPL